MMPPGRVTAIPLPIREHSPQGYWSMDRLMVKKATVMEVVAYAV